jgi:hypothetical protein
LIEVAVIEAPQNAELIGFPESRAGQRRAHNQAHEYPPPDGHFLCLSCAAMFLFRVTKANLSDRAERGVTFETDTWTNNPPYSRPDPAK